MDSQQPADSVGAAGALAVIRQGQPGLRMRLCSGLIIAFSITLVGCVLPSTRRTHAENMSKAEAFKQILEREVEAAASFNEVLVYLKAHNLPFESNALTIPPDLLGRDGSGRLDVEMFREKSPIWSCGSGSVGLSLHFVDFKLAATEVTSWSFDCP